MLKRPEAAPASAGAIPTIAMAEIGVITIAWPSALITLGQNSCGAAESWLRSRFMKQLAAKIRTPVPTSKRASLHFISSGASGITSSGSPVQAITSPACSESKPCVTARYWGSR